MTRSPSRYANREPEASAAFSMSIQPCSMPRSRWSRTSKSNVGPIPDLAQRDGVVLASVRGVRMREVGERRRELVAARLDLGELSLQALDLAAQLAHLGDPRLGVLARALRGGDLVGDGVAARAALLDPGQQLAAAGVQRQQLVQGLGRTAARERRASRARARRGCASGRASAAGRAAWRAYSEGRSAGRSRRPSTRRRSRRRPRASSPTTMFCGMIAPENPPLRIA